MKRMKNTKINKFDNLADSVAKGRLNLINKFQRKAMVFQLFSLVTQGRAKI